MWSTNADTLPPQLSGQANILVDDQSMPRIADFGLMSIMKDTDALDTHTSAGGIGTPRWSAPELLDPPVFGFKSCQPSKESDCYSLGMTIYEVCFMTPHPSAGWSFQYFTGPHRKGAIS